MHLTELPVLLSLLWQIRCPSRRQPARLPDPRPHAYFVPRPKAALHHHLADVALVQLAHLRTTSGTSSPSRRRTSRGFTQGAAPACCLTLFHNRLPRNDPADRIRALLRPHQERRGQ